MQTQKKDRLSTALDHMPDGPIPDQSLRVTAKLPKGVQSRELYQDVIRIAWPGFVELILTQLASMVDLMMVGSIGSTHGLGRHGAGRCRTDQSTQVSPHGRLHCHEHRRYRHGRALQGHGRA